MPRSSTAPLGWETWEGRTPRGRKCDLKNLQRERDSVQGEGAAVPIREVQTWDQQIDNQIPYSYERIMVNEVD